MNASSITTHDIIEKIAGRGHETILLAPRRCPVKCILKCSLKCYANAKITVRLTPTFVPAYIINRHANLRAILLSFFQIVLFLQALKIGRAKIFDVVVSQHHPSHFASLSAFLVSRVLRCPFIIKTHDVYDSGSNIFQKMFLRIINSIYHLVFRRADHIFVVSNPLKLSMIKTYKLNHSKISVLSNGVDTNKFKPGINFVSIKRNLQINEKKVILFIGVLRKERGLTRLVKALPIIIDKNSNLVLLFLGGGPQKAHLTKLVKAFNIERFVKFINWVNHDEIPKYICMSDVLIGPLVENVDTFGSVPRKVLEYMACGKPVVARYGGVSKDLIKDGYNGFLVYSEDPEELASLILKLINDPSLVRKVGLNAREYIRAFHDWDRLISQFEKTLFSFVHKDRG
jgi:glycosyltransferase involved in cell wall biosynthesis